MTEINDLRQRVEAAEQRFGLIDEQQRHYSDRLIGLIETIEAQLAAARSEIERQITENTRLAQENEELRGMLHSVLQSIEQKTFTRTLQDLEARVSVLVTGAQPDGSAAAEATGPEATGPETADPEALAGAEESQNEAGPSEAQEEPAVEAVVELQDTSEQTEPAVIVEAGEETAEEEALQVEVSGQSAENDLASPAGPVATDTFEASDADEIDAEEPEDFAAQAAIAAAGVDDAGEEATGAAALEGEAELGSPGPEMTEPETAEAEIAEADMAEADMAEPDMVEPDMAEPAEDPAEAAFDGSAAAGIQKVAVNAAPTVKEIIRRVGDLARELEKAEAQRRAARDTAETPTPSRVFDDDLPMERFASA